MGLLALALALLIEQARPLPENNWIHRGVVALADFVINVTNAGERRHGVLGWCAVMLGVALALSVVEWAVVRVHPAGIFVVHVVVLYLCVGFRQFSHGFTIVQLALAEGDLPKARAALQSWLRSEGSDRTVTDADVATICRLSIANALVASHRHVFGPLLWYIVIPGVSGPVLYRMAEMLARRWASSGDDYGAFASRAYRWIDWPALRLSAAGFAIVGNFEDAVFAWRACVAAGLGTQQRALLLATGGGALGLRLSDPSDEASVARAVDDQDEGGLSALTEPMGQSASPDSLRSAVGLVWRSVVLWVGLFALLSIANWLGR